MKYTTIQLEKSLHKRLKKICKDREDMVRKVANEFIKAGIELNEKYQEGK